MSTIIIPDSLTRQQFSVITSSLIQSLRIACSFTVFPYLSKSASSSAHFSHSTVASV